MKTTSVCRLPSCIPTRSRSGGALFLLVGLIGTACAPSEAFIEASQIELGQRLFFDPQLSIDGKRACGTCHEQEKAFTDGFPRAVGHAADLLPRNTLSLVNVAERRGLLWIGDEELTLQAQLDTPLFGRSPPEMGMGGHETELLTRLQSDRVYERCFSEAFPDADEPVTLDNMGAAIVAFQRQIVSRSSPYDRYLGGEIGALSPGATRGMALFFGEPLNCFRCHSGSDLDQPADPDGTVRETVGRFNTGLYNVDGAGAYPDFEQGRIAETGLAEDMGVFRVPMLRNLTETAPFMHDGSVPTLGAVIDNYAAGGRVIRDGPYAGDGRSNPHKHPLITGFQMSATQRADLLAFLESLSDPDLLTRPELSDPFR
ncbi:MAG: di-heme enzyme [Myxococcales bacterium]|nr:di-heme enzyme [Myxococcales bacterium]